MNAIVRANPAANAVATFVGGRFADFPKGSPVRGAIVDLHLAFPAGLTNLGQEEMGRRCELYAKAICGFPTLVAIGALEHLVFHNKDTPFAPTPQAVREHCERFRDYWRYAFGAYMVDGDKWEPPWFASDCPAPGTKGHPLTMEQVCNLARGRATVVIERYLNGLDGDEGFNRIRPEMFDKGERERLIARHQAAQEAAEERRKQMLRQREESRLARERAEQEAACKKEAEYKAWLHEWSSQSASVVSDELKRLVNSIGA